MVNQLIGIFVLLVLLIVGIGLLFSLPVMWLWNGLLHERAILGTALPAITWLQSWGLLILCGLLFKSSTTNSK